MTASCDLRTVVELACLTEDRTNAEQMALLRVADRVDFEHNKATVTNERAQEEPGWKPSFLYDLAQQTRVVSEDEKQKPVELRRRKGAWPRKGTDT